MNVSIVLSESDVIAVGFARFLVKFIGPHRKVVNTCAFFGQRGIWYVDIYYDVNITKAPTDNLFSFTFIYLIMCYV